MTIDKAALRKLASQAVDGPWEFKGLELLAPRGYRVLMLSGYECAADTAFIAAARTAIPDLLDQLDRAEAACGEASEALKVRDREVAWFEREVETLREGRRVKLRGTANDRAWLAANKTATSINVNAYTLALDLAEDLEAQLSACRAALGEMTSARDEACELAEAATFVIDNGLCVKCRSSVDNIDVERIDALRSVGQPK